MDQTLETYCLLFFIYSFGGWLWESTVCSLYNRGCLVNRGFLIGPYCPIYGYGALIGALLLRGIESLPLLFLAGATASCALEYATSFVLEKLFHARWWDYSDRPLNLNGRIYLPGFVAFGSAIVFVNRVIHPFLLSSLSSLPPAFVHGIVLCVSVAYLMDNLLTFTAYLRHSERRLPRL